MATVTSAIKKLEKHGYKITEKNSNSITAQQEGSERIIEITRNGGDYRDSIAVICIKKYVDNPYQDYYRTFADNITQAIRYTSIA